mmetsp:Transcript_30244/g.55250  ORF Transcript_30244/g.55250 Transcript_30244/m.55250 type:complete len:156 (+) Transcript_30244:305-772(+)
MHQLRRTAPDRRLRGPRPAFGGRGRRNRGPRNIVKGVEIDRENTCPFLIRFFPKTGSHHRVEEFADKSSLPEEACIYTWMDANLRELSELVKEIQPAARERNAKMSFSFVYPNKNGDNIMMQMGTVHSSRRSDDDLKTLSSLKFQIGDYLDVAIL